MRTQPNNKPTWPLSSSSSLPLVPSPLDLSPDGVGGGGLGEGGGRVPADPPSVQGGVARGQLGGLVVGPVGNRKESGLIFVKKQAGKTIVTI